MLEHYQRSSEEVAHIAKEIADNLISKSVRPTFHPEAVTKAIADSFNYGLPLRLRMVLCPNWTLSLSGERSIEPMPVTVSAGHLEIANPNLNIVGLLTEEIPGLISYLNQNGIRTELLIVLADILSSGWVHDPKKAKEMLQQNQKAIKLLIFSSPAGKEVFNNPQQANAKVQSQLQLATNSEGYEHTLNYYQMQALTAGTEMNKWYLEVVKQLQEMGEYAERRNDISGMWKIWERALFLAAIYALDGQMIETDFATSGFTNNDKKRGYLALGTVNTPHGDIIAQGWNLKRNTPVGVITPFNNTMGHSWAESKKPAIKF